MNCKYFIPCKYTFIFSEESEFIESCLDFVLFIALNFLCLTLCISILSFYFYCSFAFRKNSKILTFYEHKPAIIISILSVIACLISILLYLKLFSCSVQSIENVSFISTKSFKSLTLSNLPNRLFFIFLPISNMFIMFVLNALYLKEILKLLIPRKIKTYKLWISNLIAPVLSAIFLFIELCNIHNPFLIHLGLFSNLFFSCLLNLLSVLCLYRTFHKMKILSEDEDSKI